MEELSDKYPRPPSAEPPLPIMQTEAGRKVVLGVILGMAVWIFATVYYAGWAGIRPIPIHATNLIWIFIAYFVLWLGATLVSMIDHPLATGIAFSMYLVACYVTGIIAALTVRILSVDSGLPRDEIQNLFTICMIVAAVTVAVAISVGYAQGQHERDFKDYIVWFLIMGAQIIAVELLMLIFFDFSNWWVYIINPIVIVWAFIGVQIDGMQLAQKHADRVWVYLVIDIFLGVVIIFLRLFELLIMILKDR